MEPQASLEKISRRERERIRCRKAILDAATELFGKYGYERTSMKEIAERADISIGKLYIYFTGKEDLFRTLVEDHLTRMHRLADEICNVNDPPLVQLHCRMVATIEHFKKHVDFLMIYHNESPIAFEGFIRREIERYRETAADLFERAMKRREIRRTDPRVLAAILVGAAHELLYALATRGEFERFEDVPGMVEDIVLKPLKLDRGLKKEQVK